MASPGERARVFRFRFSATMTTPLIADLPRWLRCAGDDTVLDVVVQPGARKPALVGEHGDALRIRLAAPPVDGQANAALIEFISVVCGVARRDVSLVRGASSRRKQLRIAAPADRLWLRLQAALAALAAAQAVPPARR